MKQPKTTWLPVVGHEGRYSVSNRGDIRSDVTGALLSKQIVNRYYSVSLYIPATERSRWRRGLKRIHRMVAEAFIGAAPSAAHQVNHINGDKFDNRASNLEWVTPKENHDHAARAGRMALGDRHWTRRTPWRVRRGKRHHFVSRPETHPRGESCGAAKLTGEDVIRVRALRAEGMVYREIAARFGISIASAQKAVTGATWSHLR